MSRNSAKSVLVLAVLAAAGCASVAERDPVMEDARVSVDAARSNPQVVTYAPVELDQAVATMRQADDLAARGGRIEEVEQLATLANRRAVLAQEVARTRSEEAALTVQRRANEAQVAADLSRRQAESAQIQADAAQRQAEEAQRLACVDAGTSRRLCATRLRLPQAPERASVRGECELRPRRGRSAAAAVLGGTRTGRAAAASTSRAQSSAA